MSSASEFQQSAPVIPRLVDARLRQMAMIAHAAFQTAGFKWYDPAGGPNVVPDVDRMHEALREQVLRALKGGPGHSGGSGRFELSVDEHGDLTVSLDLGHIDHKDLA